MIPAVMPRGAILALGALLAASPASASGAERRVFTADDVRRAGVSRLGDLLLLAEAWDISTIDRFEWRGSPSGLASLEHPAWDLFVDGQRVDLDHLGSRNLNRLPIPLDAIESVEFLDAPGFIGGSLVEAGAIHLRTWSSSPGVTFGARATAGSETGDPGPFFYTDPTAVDVERDGFETSASLGWGGASVSLRGSVLAAEHLAADHAILDRLRAVGPRRPWIYDLFAASGAAAWTTGAGRIDVDGGVSRLEHAWFLRPWGREIPARDEHRQVRARGRRRAGPADLDVGVSWFGNRTSTRTNADDLDLDWDRHALLVSAGAAFEGRAGYTRLGTEAERVRAGSGVQGFTIGRVTADLSPLPKARVRSHVGLELSYADAETGGKIFVHEHWSDEGPRSLDAIVGWSRALPVDDPRIWLWRERGLDFLEASDLAPEIEGRVSGAELLSFDLEAATEIGGGVVATLRPMIRVHSRLTVERQLFRTDRDATAFESPTELLTDVGGGLVGFEARIRGGDRRVTWHASYRYQTVFDAEPAFEMLWAPVPEHRARITVDVEPARGLNIRGVTRALGARSWPEYTWLTEDSGGRHAFEIDPSLTFDLVFRQTLLHDRLDLGLTFLNLFDQEIAEHAIGADSGLRFILRAELQLGRSR